MIMFFIDMASSLEYGENFNSYLSKITKCKVTLSEKFINFPLNKFIYTAGVKISRFLSKFVENNESMMELRYPIGIQTFSEIIQKGYTYVDKTGYIPKLTQHGKRVGHDF